MVFLSIQAIASLARLSERYTRPSAIFSFYRPPRSTIQPRRFLLARYSPFYSSSPPLAFALVRSAPSIDRGSPHSTFLFCGFLIVDSEGAFNTAFFIHADAAALAFATVACTFAGSHKRITAARHLALRPRRARWPSPANRPSRPWLSRLPYTLRLRRAETIRVVFVRARGVTGGVLLALLLSILPARAFIFNTLMLAAHRPLKPGYLEILVAAYRMGRLEALPALLPVLFLAMVLDGGEPKPASGSSSPRTAGLSFSLPAPR